MANRIACGFRLAESQQDHFGSPFFLLYAAWVRSRAERPSVSCTKVVSKVARTGHNLHLQKRIKQQNCGSNNFLHRGDGKMERMLEPSIKLIGEVHRMRDDLVGTGSVSLLLFLTKTSGGLVALALSTFWQHETVHSDAQVDHLFFTNSLPLYHMYIPYSVLPLLPSTPPRHEYILNDTWRSHRNLPCGLSQVYAQYPRPEVFLMTSSFSCMRLPP